MMRRTSSEIQSLQVGDEAVFMDGDVPFTVAAASEVVHDVRQLDLVRAGGDGWPLRVTIGAHQRVVVVVG